MPLSITFMSDATIMIGRLENFQAIFDTPEQGITALFTPECFLVGEKDTLYDYNVPIAYKEEPELLAWLQQQKLIQPE